jgi:hypothetical protein
MADGNGSGSLTWHRDAEASVLGAVLLHNDAIDRCELEPSDFFDPRHRAIWAAMLRLAAKGQAIDPVLLELELGGRVKAIGWEFLSSLVSTVPTADNVEHYAAIVRADALTRSVQVAASEILGSGLEGEELRQYVVDRLGQLAADRPDGGRGGVIGALWRPVKLGYLVEPPPPRRWLLRHPTRDGGPCPAGHGDGLLPLGKVGVLSSAGGVGKTHLLLLLAVGIITGRPWLGHFHIGYDARGKRVFLGLAEEDDEEIHRRLYAVAEAYELTQAERDHVAERLVVLPLAGHPVALVGYEHDGVTLTETPELASLRERLAADAGPGWALVALDPLARWAGPDVEADNSVATRFLQAVERLATAPGDPTVIFAHHSSKVSRKEGGVDARGVTAITDGARWAGTLRVDGADVFFAQHKSNYSRPMIDDLRLIREEGGILRAAEPAEDDARDQARSAARQAREEEALAVMEGRLCAALMHAEEPLTSRAQVCHLVTGSYQVRQSALTRLIAARRVVKVERAGARVFEVAGAAVRYARCRFSARPVRPVRCHSYRYKSRPAYRYTGTPAFIRRTGFTRTAFRIWDPYRFRIFGGQNERARSRRHQGPPAGRAGSGDPAAGSGASGGHGPGHRARSARAPAGGVLGAGGPGGPPRAPRAPGGRHAR